MTPGILEKNDKKLGQLKNTFEEKKQQQNVALNNKRKKKKDT